MKPKFRKHLRSAFPSLIIIPAMTALLQSVSHAAIIVADSFGNVTLNDNTNNGANTIRANGGTSLTPTVLATSTVNLTGDVGETEVLEITTAGYTVTLNTGAVFNGTNHDGIFSNVAFTLLNSGIIDGNGIGTGVLSVGGTTSITNSGTISSENDAILFNTDGGTVTNTGTILGDADGIFGDNNVTIFNNGSGSITGLDDGVHVLDNLDLTNQTNATITGTNSDGIIASNDAIISNSGLIQGGDDGVDVGEDATITNVTTYNIFANPIAGGTIIGSDDGVQAGNFLVLTNQYLGLIQGTNGEGINAGDNADIYNYGTITGDFDGIDVGETATIDNFSIITGGADGINAGPGATITNYAGATITGGQDGIDIDGLGVASTITNYGTITGGSGQAIDGSSSVETLNLYFGSRVIGDVEGNGGIDILNFIGGLTTTSSASGSSSNSILGNVEEFDVINKSGTGVAFIGVPGDTGYSVEVNTINITGNGGLYINGDIFAYTALQTIINAGGAALGGTGLWKADIMITAGGISAGAIPINLDAIPNNAIGTLDLDGDVTHSSGTFICHDINPLTGNDDLIFHSGGTYALGGNTDIRVSATDNDTVIGDGVYTVINSNSLITGALPDMAVQFNQNVNDNDFGFVGTRTGNTGVGDTLAVINQFMWSGFTDSGTNLVFYVEHDYAGIGSILGSNEAALGAALDASVDNSNILIQDFIAALDYSDINTVNQTLSSLVPSDVFGLTASVLNSNYRLHRLAQNHLATTRSGGTVVERAPDTVDAKGHTVAGGTTTSSSASGMGNVWGTFSYDWQDSDYVDGEVAAFTVGFDYRVAPNFLIGLMLDGSQADMDYSGGSSDVDSLRAALYATYGESTGLYADFLVGYGDHDFDSNRRLGGLVGGNSNNSTDATSLQAMAVVGYAIQSDSIKHGPFAGLEYQNVDVDAYSQSGLLPIGVSGYDVDSLRGLVGYRAETTYGNFTPYASIAYAHEFEDGDQSTTATLPGGTSFRVSGGELDSAILLGLGTGYSINSNLSLNVGYRGEISTEDGLDSHGGSIGLNYSF